MGSKNVVLKFRSVSNMVIAAARTGIDKIKRMAVKTTDQTNRGIKPDCMPLGRMFLAVVMKLAEARIDETPARCREKIARSTAGPEWNMLLARGG